MIRVQQRIVDPVNGDCLRACVASLLELPYNLVPNFIDYKENHLKVFMDFMRSIAGYESTIVSHDNRPFKDGIHEMFDGYGTIKGLTIASIKSKKYPGGSHAVLINENYTVVFDPTTDLDYSQEGGNLSGSDDLYGYWIFKY